MFNLLLYVQNLEPWPTYVYAKAHKCLMSVRGRKKGGSEEPKKKPILSKFITTMQCLKINMMLFLFW